MTRIYLAVTVLVGVTAAVRPVPGADPPAVYTWPGPRQAAVSVSERDGLLEAEVRMKPVTVFEAGWNLRLNELKARQYALLAIVRYLNLKPAGSLSVSGAIARGLGVRDGLYAMKVTVPRGELASIEPSKATADLRAESASAPPSGMTAPAAPAEAIEPIVLPERKDWLADTAEAAPLAARAEYEETIAQLEELLGRDISALAEDSLDQDGCLAAVALVKAQIDELHAALDRQIAEERLLLGLEKEDLSRTRQESHARLVEKLRSAGLECLRRARSGTPQEEHGIQAEEAKP